MTENQKFGAMLAEHAFNEGWPSVPFVLNSEQATAFYKRYKQIQRQKS